LQIYNWLSQIYQL